MCRRLWLIKILSALLDADANMKRVDYTDTDILNTPKIGNLGTIIEAANEVMKLGFQVF